MLNLEMFPKNYQTSVGSSSKGHRFRNRATKIPRGGVMTKGKDGLFDVRQSYAFPAVGRTSVRYSFRDGPQHGAVPFFHIWGTGVGCRTLFLSLCVSPFASHLYENLRVQEHCLLLLRLSAASPTGARRFQTTVRFNSHFLRFCQFSTGCGNPSGA